MPPKQAAIPFKQAGKNPKAGKPGPRTPNLRDSNFLKTGSGGPTRNARPPQWRVWLANPWLIMAVALLIWNVFSVINARPASNPIVNLPYSTFFDQLNAGNVSEVNIQGNAVSGSLKAQIIYPQASGTPSPAASAATRRRSSRARRPIASKPGSPTSAIPRSCPR